MTFVAVATLFLTVASLVVVGGAAFALFLFFPLFLLALVGILARLDDRNVPQHDPATNARSSPNRSQWRASTSEPRSPAPPNVGRPQSASR